MTSLRHTTSPDMDVLDAAREAILAVGWRRTTLTDVARRAGVSRMTLYRRWPDMTRLLADLMTCEWSGLVAEAMPVAGSARERIATGVTRMVAALRANELFAKIVRVDPELLLPYLLERRGRTQEAMLDLLERVVREGQRDGSVRPGNPAVLARTVLLSAHGFALSAPTMTDGSGKDPSPRRLDRELSVLLNGYLSP